MVQYAFMQAIQELCHITMAACVK